MRAVELGVLLLSFLFAVDGNRNDHSYVVARKRWRNIGLVASTVPKQEHRRIYVRRAHGNLRDQPKRPSAAIYTNTTLQSFEFTHQFVAVIAALQTLGYSVDVLRRTRVPRMSTVQLADMALDHGFQVDVGRLSLAPAKIVGSRLHTPNTYSLFVSLGDDRAPPYMGIGGINIYICTYPYLPEVAMEPESLYTLPSYDAVLLSSSYAYEHYLFYTELYMIPAVRDNEPIPTIVSLPPPFHPGASAPPSPQSNYSIVVPGHFAYNYEDVHSSALSLFGAMQPKLPPGTRLVLYGSTGHAGYLTTLKKLALRAPIDIITDPTPQHQMELLASANVAWFMRREQDETLQWRKPEPDTEWRLYQMMGVTVASAMRAGTLPVVIDNDVHDAVIDGDTGYVVNGWSDVLQATLRAFDLSSTEWQRMTKAGAAKVVNRSFETYVHDLDAIIRQARANRPLRQAMTAMGNVQGPSSVVESSQKMAVCVEFGHHFALRLSVLNVMSHLPSWSLTVFHGLANKRFVSSVLLDLNGMQVRQLPYSRVSAIQYDEIVRSFTFWSSINADTVFLFSAGTVLTGGLDSLLGLSGVLAAALPFDRPAHDLGRPAIDSGVHGAVLIDVKKARLGDSVTTTPSNLCLYSADGDCYRKIVSSAVAITATAAVDDTTRINAMLSDALGVTPDAAPSSLSWNLYTPSAGAPKTAAMYTPYDILYGGGEGYFLQSAASLQSFGYTVDIIVHPENVAETVDDVMRTAQGLRVDLKRNKLRLLHVTHAGDTLAMLTQGYSVFYLLGNEKAPKLRGFGLVNLYMCQFPFDLDKPLVPPRTRTLATYDYVLVNSHFTYAYYAKFASSLFASMVDADMLVPQVELLYPPVQPFSSLHPQPTTRRHIALLGRIFLARQNKGQHVAIAAFKALQGRLPPDVRLLVIGNVVPGHEPYLESLKRKASGLNVDILTGQTHDRVLELLSSALIQWHMTGADAVMNDPASYEHFGMAIVEGMSLGCVPVVLKRGGVVDIVRDGVNGYLGTDLDGIVEKTALVYGLTSSELLKVASMARTTASEFSPQKFTRKFKVMLDRGFLTRPFKHAIKYGAPLLRKQAPLVVARSAANVAVLIEPRQHYALRFTTLNVMTHLPRASWSLHMFYGVTNGRFARSVLSDIDGARYTRLPYGVMTIPQYNDLLKSEAFWTSMHAVNVLLYQTDSLLLNTNIGDFVGRYDYIGAPWHQENERWSVMRHALPGGVGNGGLSLRTTASALGIIRQHGNASNWSEQEDVFFARLMRGDGFRLAPRQRAYEFCLEVTCVDLKAIKRPFAVHAPWYYNDETRMAGLLDHAVFEGEKGQKGSL